MIWVVAGTKSARDLVKFFIEKNIKVIATTTTDYGRKLLGEHENLTTVQGKLSPDDMYKLIKQYEIKTIIDSTHPYAAEVKENLISLSKETGISCLRYERENIEIKNGVFFGNYEDAAKYIETLSGNILMTIGSQNLHSFRETTEQKIYARVLPMESSIRQCSNAGYTPDRIIAMKSIFSKDFNKSLLHELNIKYMLTKESGNEGGVKEKIDAADELGIEIIVIKRPSYKYNEVFYNCEEIYKRIKDI